MSNPMTARSLHTPSEKPAANSTRYEWGRREMGVSGCLPGGNQFLFLFDAGIDVADAVSRQAICPARDQPESAD